MLFHGKKAGPKMNNSRNRISQLRLPGLLPHMYAKRPNPGRKCLKWGKNRAYYGLQRHRQTKRHRCAYVFDGYGEIYPQK